MKRIWLLALAALLSGTVGCNGGSSGSGGPGGSSTFSATVDGVDWTAEITSAVRQSGFVVVTGADPSPFSIQISFSEGSSSPIPIDETTEANGVVHDNSVVWATTVAGGTGSIEVTELTSAGVKGTFSFTTGANNSETPAVRTVTNGTFEVEF
jgi:hypothetical protein